MDERIHLDPAVHHGKPTIRGTRVPVARIVGSLAAGMTAEDVVREYELTMDDVRAALDFAARTVDGQAFYPLPKSA